MDKQQDLTDTTSLTERCEILARPDMRRAIDIYGGLIGGNRSSVTRMLWAELLDAKLPGWRDPAFQRLSDDQARLRAQQIQSAQQRKTRECGCRTSTHRLSCPDRP